MYAGRKGRARGEDQDVVQEMAMAMETKADIDEWEALQARAGCRVDCAYPHPHRWVIGMDVRRERRKGNKEKEEGTRKNADAPS